MRKFFPRRIWTILLLLAALGVGIVATPWLWWRFRVFTALESTLATGPDFQWRVNPLDSNERDDFAYLLSDYERVMGRLMEVAESDAPADRRVNALKTMQVISAKSGSVESRRQALPRLIELACDGQTPQPVLHAVTAIIADWIPTTGVSDKERADMRDRAVAASGEQRVAWIPVLVAIGGREEVFLLLEFGDTHDSSELWALYNSQFRFIKWPGMLPHVSRWIRDPVIAEYALDYSVLNRTEDGRLRLLEFISDEAQLPALRTQALENMVETLAGIELVAAACSDPQYAKMLSELLGRDAQVYLTKEKAKTEDRNGDDLWSQLIDGLDPAYSYPPSAEALPVEVASQFKEYSEQQAQSSLTCLRLLSGRSDLTTQSEWRKWRESASPSVVAQSELLSLVLDDPELMANSAMFRRIVPYQFGFIPDDCVPLYERMLNSDDEYMRYWACHALLAFSDSTDAARVAIDLIDESQPNDAASIHPGQIAMLQKRFAVNFFWDTDAWRAWARDPQSVPAQPPNSNTDRNVLHPAESP